MRPNGNCTVLNDVSAILLLVATLSLIINSKNASADMLLELQLLNYSNPYFQLKVDGEVYHCLYTFHTWNPRHAVHYKCRLSFTVLVVADAQLDDSLPTLISTKLISVPLSGPLRGIIDFANPLPLDFCSTPLECNDTTWTQPLTGRYVAKPRWIKVIVTHHGALTDSQNKFIAVDQSFVVDQFDINVTETQVGFSFSDDEKTTGDDDETFRARNRKLMTSLGYRLGIRCAQGYYGRSCDLKNCIAEANEPNMVVCEKGSHFYRHCVKEPCSQPLTRVALDVQNEINKTSADVYKLSTFILAFIAALEAFVIFADVYLRRIR